MFIDLEFFIVMVFRQHVCLLLVKPLVDSLVKFCALSLLVNKSNALLYYKFILVHGVIGVGAEYEYLEYQEQTAKTGNIS
ncbi:hypothetical protein ACTHGU_18110 [Chitinophagaceae bacterium MMS25-I14]